MVGIKHESMRKGQTSHKKEHNTRMCFPLKPVFTRDKGGLPNFIDEPTNGLDPQAIFDLRNKLLTIRNEGTSILLSSHQLSELDKLADRALFIKSGKLIKEKNMDELRQNHSIYRLEVSNPKDVLLLLKNSFIKEHVLYMQCDSKEEFSKSLQILIQNDILVYSVAEVHQDLETYYKELYKG